MRTAFWMPAFVLLAGCAAIEWPPAEPPPANPPPLPQGAEADRPATLPVGTVLVTRDREPLTGTVLHEARWVVSAVRPESVAFNDGDMSLWRGTAAPREGRWPGAMLSGFDAGRLQAGERLQVQFRPAGAEDAAVPVELRVERDEPVAVGHDGLMLLRARLSGHASLLGPDQVPQASRGARIDGRVWIERTSGLVVRAVVDCLDPAYAWKRELVRATLPAARPQPTAGRQR